jgi:hypothetical protein
MAGPAKEVAGVSGVKSLHLSAVRFASDTMVDPAPTGSEAFGREDELELLGSLATLAGLWVTAFAVVRVFYWPLFRWHRNLMWNPGPRRH